MKTALSGLFRVVTKNTFLEIVEETIDNETAAAPPLWSAPAGGQAGEDWQSTSSRSSQQQPAEPTCEHQMTNGGQHPALRQDHSEQCRSVELGGCPHVPYEIKNTFIELKDDSDDQAAKINSAPVPGRHWEEFQEQEYATSICRISDQLETRKDDEYGKHPDCHHRDRTGMLCQIEMLREQLQQLGEHADLVASGPCNSYKEHT